MATSPAPTNGAVSKIDAAAEKAYAVAAAKTKPTDTDANQAPVKKAAAAKKVAAKKAPVKKVAAKKTAPKTLAAKPAAKKAAKTKSPTKKAAKRKPAAKKNAKLTVKSGAATSPVSKIKDTIMAKAKDTNFTDSAKDMAADVQTRVKTAAAKATEFAGEFGEFNKDNLDAVVESGKILFAGAQEMGRGQIATGKTVVETVTSDVKKMTAVKSPTELVQLQGELARRNIDAAISFGSKNTESWLKIYNDAFAPISSRVSVAAERFKKAA